MRKWLGKIDLRLIFALLMLGLMAAVAGAPGGWGMP